jgi:xyloglucan-specific exo-beta-1,4-glucanase
VAYAVGFGKSAPTTSFGPSAKPAPPAIYMAGKLSGTAGEDAATSGGGIYRSLDDGSTWQRIDDPEHRFAWIEQITGDPRLFGRVYMGTNGRGVLIGDPQ